MTNENIKELKRNIVIYKMETTGIEKENYFSNSYVIESLTYDNDLIIYNRETYKHDGEDDTTCTVILYDNVNDFLKASCKEIINKINDASYYNTITVEF